MKYDVIIIGAGQAGLSMGNYLQQTNRFYIIFQWENPLVKIY